MKKKRRERSEKNRKKFILPLRVCINTSLFFLFSDLVPFQDFRSCSMHSKKGNIKVLFLKRQDPCCRVLYKRKIDTGKRIIMRGERRGSLFLFFLFAFSFSLYLSLSFAYVATNGPSAPFVELLDGASWYTRVPGPQGNRLGSLSRDWSSGSSAISSVDSIYHTTSFTSTENNYDCQIFTCGLGPVCLPNNPINVTWVGYNFSPSPVKYILYLHFISVSLLFICFFFSSPLFHSFYSHLLLTPSAMIY